MSNQSLIEANRATVMRFFDGTHSGNLDVIAETVAENIVTQGFPGGFNPASHDEYRQFFLQFAQGFSDLRYDVLSVVADERQVAVRFLIEVTHSGPFAGVQPTNRRVTFIGMVLYRMEAARIAETWLHVDELALLSQIGAIGPAAALAA
jgi:predicted ester cyclase